MSVLDEQQHEMRSTLIRGMDDLVIDTTAVSWIDGENNTLYYRGIDVVELCAHSNFEETAYLLLCGQLPTLRQLRSFSWKLHQMTQTKEQVLHVLQEMPPQASPLLMLQTALSTLACIESSLRESSNENLFETGMRIIAQTPVILASAYRHHLNAPFVSPRQDFTYAENFLYMLTGKMPSKHQARCMEIVLMVLMDNGFTPSTFAARAVASTQASMYSSVTAATAALSGHIVGGACAEAFQMVEQIRESGAPALWVSDRLARRLPIAGLGHRVYTRYDPRANILEHLLETLVTRSPAERSSLRILREVRSQAQTQAHQLGEAVFANVDFWTGAIYELLGIRPFLYPAITAAARVVGWASHIIELRADNCLYRPRSKYIGKVNIPYIPMEARSEGADFSSDEVTGTE